MNRRGARPMSGHDPGRLSACVCNTLRMVSRAVTQLYDDVLRPSGLRITQFSILATIARMGASNLRQLEDTLAIDQTTLTRSLNLLERDRVIERVAHPDGRIKAMRLTSKGRRALEVARPLWTQAQQRDPKVAPPRPRLSSPPLRVDRPGGLQGGLPITPPTRDRDGHDRPGKRRTGRRLSGGSRDERPGGKSRDDNGERPHAPRN